MLRNVWANFSASLLNSFWAENPSVFILDERRHFEAVEARFLRASYSAFVDVLTLATKTIEEFGKGMELWQVVWLASIATVPWNEL